MIQYFKTLEFKNKKLGYYARPFENFNNSWSWLGGDIPLMMSNDATLKDLEQLYHKLDFNKVILVTKIVGDYSDEE